MKLYEIAEGEQIEIIARLEHTSVQYETIVAFCQKGILCAELVHHEGKIVNFSGDQVHISIVYTPSGDKPLIWDNCGTQIVQTKAGKYMAIVSKRDGKPLNRRQAFRQYIGLEGLLTIDSSREKKNVMVKDISVGGISFVGSPEMTIASIGAFHLEFEDRTNRMSVHLAGNVVREEPVDENKKIFGGIVTRSNVDLGSYIAMKQKQEISKHSF